MNIPKSKVLNEEALVKKLKEFSKEGGVEINEKEMDYIVKYINQVFTTYMKNLIERLLQSSIVENIDNEFRLFCSEKLESYLVPFRNQPIDKYLLNKPDSTRDMTFLKYAIVQSENKNIRR